MATELEEKANEKLNGESSPELNADGTPKRKRGRPKGSKNRPKDGSQPRPIDTDSTGSDAPPHDWRNFEYRPVAASIAASTILGETVWGIASLMLPVRPLEPAEADKLGHALDPVLCRWLPIFGDWKHELGLFLCIMGLVATTKIEKKPTNSEATVIDDATPGA